MVGGLVSETDRPQAIIMPDSHRPTRRDHERRVVRCELGALKLSRVHSRRTELNRSTRKLQAAALQP